MTDTPDTPDSNNEKSKEGSGDQSKPKLIMLPPKTPIVGEEELEKARKAVPLAKEWYKLAAVMHKAKYDELIKQGFNPSQALELCKDLFVK